MKIQPRQVGRQTPVEDAGEPELIGRISGEIERDGPVSFARFMERALYEPGLGYYSTSDDRATRSGDFLTAPELHPIFGWTVARQLEQMWRRLGQPEPLVVREYGAGTGRLGADVVDGLSRAGSGLAGSLRYEPLEVAGRLPQVDRAGRFVGCVIANEFLDALPFHRMIYEQGEWQELMVGWRDGRFVEVIAEPFDDRLAERVAEFGAEIEEGHRVEINLRMADWLAAVANELERGYLLLFDYARPRLELLSAAFATGTARAFSGQHVSSDVLSGVGQRDITATVDLDALQSDGRAAGLDVVGVAAQAEFLLGCGLDAVYHEARAEADRDWDSALELRAAMRRLLDPLHLGGYAAVILAKDVPTIGEPLLGLSFAMTRPG